MKLSREDTNLFFKLMWGLQFHVNRQRQILPNIKSTEEYAKLPMSDKVEVRDALWAYPDLIDTYVQNNPDGLSIDELELVRTWKRFVSSSFQIFRFLKKYAVFVSEKSGVFGVLGLYDSLEELFNGRPLPIMVQAVLLPFKGRIVYDGLLKRYNITFGGGIRSGLKEEYMAAQQNGRIITTLEPEGAASPQVEHECKLSKDFGPIDELVKGSEQLRGGSPIQSAAFTLLRASARLAQSTLHRPDELDELRHLGRQLQRALNRLKTVLARAER